MENQPTLTHNGKPNACDDLREREAAPRVRKPLAELLIEVPAQG